jgi:hypothetical protein
MPTYSDTKNLNLFATKEAMTYNEGQRLREVEDKDLEMTAIVIWSSGQTWVK